MTIGLILAIVIALIVVGLILMKKKPTPPPPPTPPPIPPPPETVKIDVCATSGLIPNPYCPQIVSREFEKGKEPTTQCGIHKKPDPPPPPPPPKPDRAPFYVGTSVYEEMEFPEEEIDYFLETGYSNGMNITEIFASYSWSRGASIQPYLLVGDLFDYTKENPVYWNRLRHIMTRCAPPDLDIALIIRLFDGCSIKDDDDYEKLVWHHSIQKSHWQDPKPKGLGLAWGGFYGTTATDGKGPRPYYSAFVNRIRAIALETGCVVIFHAMNEPGYNPTKGEVENWIG
jgi:hypothetical protein